MQHDPVDPEYEWATDGESDLWTAWQVSGGVRDDIETCPVCNWRCLKHESNSGDGWQQTSSLHRACTSQFGDSGRDLWGPTPPRASAVPVTGERYSLQSPTTRVDRRTGMSRINNVTDTGRGSPRDLRGRPDRGIKSTRSWMLCDINSTASSNCKGRRPNSVAEHTRNVWKLAK